MKAQPTFIIAFLTTVVATHFAVCQESGQNHSEAVSYPFVSTATSVPEGYSISFAAANPFYAKRTLPMSARVSIGIASVLQLHYSNEGTIANIIGVAEPLDNWGVKLQILPNRQQFPSVSLWFRGIIGWQHENLWDGDVAPISPQLIQKRFVAMNYRFTSTSAGIAAESRPGEFLFVNFSLGFQEIRARGFQIFMAPDPFSGNRYSDVGTDQWVNLDASASASMRLLPEVTVVGELSMLPYFNVILPAPKLEVDRAYVAILGLRYALPIPLYVDTYVRWQSSVNEIAYTQLRLGLSGQLSFTQ